VRLFRRKTNDPFQSFSPFDRWFWVFVLLSLAMAWFIGRETFIEWRTSRWPKVPCEILTSQLGMVQRGSKSYPTPLITYRYQFNGRIHVSSQIRPQSSPMPLKMDGIQTLLTEYPAGRKAECHVNPTEPNESALEARPAYFLPLIAVFPMGLWLVYNWVPFTAWLRLRRTQKGTSQLRPLATGRAALKSGRKEMLIGVISVLFSGVLLTFLLVAPWWKSRHAEHWQPTPCRILQADVRTETHHQGYSFKADISYSYEFAGKKYVSTQRDFSELSGVSFANTESAVAGFVPGTTNVCYVNPVRPGEAVLRREFHVDWFMTLFMLAWFTLGAWLAGHGAYSVMKPLQSVLPWERLRGRAREVKPAVALGVSQTPGLMLGLCAAGGLACLLIGGWLGSEVLRSLRRGGFDFLPALYALACGVGVYQCVRLGRKFYRGWLNLPPRLGVRPAVLAPGQTFQVAWVWDRGAALARPFRLWLEGREEAFVVTYNPGPHGMTRNEKLQKTTFHRAMLAEISAQVSGTQEFVLPKGVMHSFEGARTNIVWYLKAEVLGRGSVGEHEHRIMVRAGSMKTA
jgi:hypothetical protein